MNSRAQAGMEFLLTYGWALILVMTVIGILVVFLNRPTAGDLQCIVEGNDFVLKGSAVNYSLESTPKSQQWLLELYIQNNTGSKIRLQELRYELLNQSPDFSNSGQVNYLIGNHSFEASTHEINGIPVSNDEDIKKVAVGAGSTVVLDSVSIAFLETSGEEGKAADFSILKPLLKETAIFSLAYKDNAGVEGVARVLCNGWLPVLE